MIDVALSILALVAGGLALEFFTLGRASLEYVDDRGFQFGNAPTHGSEEFQSGNPS